MREVLELSSESRRPIDRKLRGAEQRLRCDAVGKAAATGTVSDASTRVRILAGVEVQRECAKPGKESGWVEVA